MNNAMAPLIKLANAILQGARVAKAGVKPPNPTKISTNVMTTAKAGAASVAKPPKPPVGVALQKGLARVKNPAQASTKMPRTPPPGATVGGPQKPGSNLV